MPRCCTQCPCRMKAALALFAAATTLFGCDRDEIRAYSAPKDQLPVISTPAGAPGDPPMGAINWRLPSGWNVSSESRPMRYATVIAEEGVELSVTRLAGEAGGIIQNVNRWRGQIGLDPASEENLKGQMRLIDAGAGQGILVTMRGPGTDVDAPVSNHLLAAIYPARDSTWFVKMVGPELQIEPHIESFVAFALSVQLPGQSLPDWFTQAYQANAPPTPPQWSVPANWTPDEDGPAMSIATFRAGEEPNPPVVTVTPIPGRAGTSLDNVNRWRAQVGLERVTTLAEQAATALTIDGEQTSLYDIASPGRRILVVMTRRRSITTFFKMIGHPDAVEGQKQSFVAFVESIRFEHSDE